MNDEPTLPRNRRRILIIASVAIVLAGSTTMLVLRNSGDTGVPAAQTDARSPKTVRVTLTDLNDSQTVPGTLGFGAAQTVQGNEGTVTWLPAPGTVVSRNEQVLRVDDHQVVLFYGTTPLFRALDTRNLVGRDVKVVADNLRALGYAIGSQPRVGSAVEQNAPAQPTAPTGAATPAPAVSSGAPPPPVRVQEGDAVLTDSLIMAIKRWQRASGQPQTGVVGVRDVLVLPDAVRVAAVPGRLGGPANAPLLSVTSTGRLITVQIDPGVLGSVKQGDKVQVLLPGGEPAAATVTVVTTEAPAGSDGGPAPAQKTNITLAPDDPAAVADLEPGAVQVEFTTKSRNGVLAVPVNALLALREGGYAVQVKNGGLVPVTTGLFVRGMAEITGNGIADGTEVVTVP